MRILFALAALLLAPLALADSLFPATATPTSADDAEGTPVELGVQFLANTAGQVTAIRFHKGAANAGPHTATLWDSAGTKLASASFSNETASGWQEAKFGAPVSIQPGIRYTASYFAPAGHYSSDRSYFTSAMSSGALTAPVNAGVYRDGASGFPTSTYGASNYWVDVTFVAGTAPAPPGGTTYTGSRTVLWTPPTTNSDGSALTDLAGYRVLYGPAPNQLTGSLSIPNPGTLTATIDGLTAGDWYFGVVAFTKSGIESDLSTVVKGTVTATTPPPPPPPPPVPTYVVRAATSGTRPAYELVRNQADTAWTQGYKLGDIAVGKPCDAAAQLGASTTNEYHKVAESDAVLLSPTYRGRTLIAVCVKAK